MKNTDGHGPARTRHDGLIPRHGGYRNTKTFQLAELIYDVTVRFCEKFVSPRSRTYDQMVQAARSGNRNISEGSVDSATSKKMELKLTGVAKGSLEELLLDYEAFLRQRGLPKWDPNHPALLRFKSLRCASLEGFRRWVASEVQRAESVVDGGDMDGHPNTDRHEPAGTGASGSEIGVSVGPCPSVSTSDLPALFAANGALSLLNLCMYRLGRQMEAQAAAFEREGGFTERLYRRRMERRGQMSHKDLVKEARAP